MRLGPKSTALALLGALLVATAPSALAQVSADAKAAAEALFNQGRALMEAGRFAEAADKFEASNRFDPGVGTLLNLGVCREQSGQHQLAWETFRVAAEEARKTADQRESYALERMNSLAGKLFFLWIEVPPQTHAQDMHVVLDGKPLPAGSWGRPIVVAKGAHTVQASAPGVTPFETRVDVTTPGQEVRIDVPVLQPEALPQPASSPDPADDGGEDSSGSSRPSATMSLQDQAPGPSMPLGRKVALGSVAIGAAGLVLGSIKGLQASGLYGDAEELCPVDSADLCTPVVRAESQDKRDSARSAANLATASFVVGIGAVAAGAALWFLSPPAPSDATRTARKATHIEPLIGPSVTGLGIRTTF